MGYRKRYRVWEVEKVEYHIRVNGNKIASFEHDADRDICIDALREWWGEENHQEFIAEDD